MSWLSAPPLVAVQADDNTRPHATQTQQGTQPAPPHNAAAALHQSPARQPRLPDFASLAEFDHWAAAGTVPFAHWSPRPALPSGPETPDIMVISDYPEIADCMSGQLFSGEQGALVAAMLKAIDLDFSAQRTAAISFTRPPTQRLDPQVFAVLGPLLHQQIALAKPRSILILGTRAAGILTGRPHVPEPDAQPQADLKIGKITPFVTYHPRELIARPQLKRHAWEVLKRLRKEL